MNRIIRILTVSSLVLPAFISEPARGAVDERPAGSALQFGIYGYNNLTTFGGTTISYQRFISRNIALRIGSTIELDLDSIDSSGKSTGDLGGKVKTELEEWNNSFSLNCEFLVYRGSALSLFYGGGPYAAYSNRQSVWFDPYYYYNGAGARARKNRTKEFDVGLTGTIGVQWAPSAWCAIHAEYRVSAAYSSEELYVREERAGVGTNYVIEETMDTEGVVFDSKGVRFGLSIYF